MSVLGLVAVAPLGAGPQFWRAATQADFLKGDLEALAVDEHGRLTLGPTIARVYDAGVPFVWTAASGPGGVVFLGTGNDGKVFKVDADGRGALFYDAPELQVHALLPRPDGSLLVGTSPDGRVYQVDAAGTAREFFDPEEKYIWALAADQAGRVYVATGDPKGRVYRLAADGTGGAHYTSSSAHVMTLLPDGDRLVVGTEGPGRVFRLDADGRPFLLLDTGLQEVRAVRRDGEGRLFVVAQARRSGGGDGGSEPFAVPEPARPAPVPTVTTEITAVAVVDMAAAAASAPSRPAGPAAGALFRINTDGTWDELWEAREDAPYDVALEGRDTLLVATGHKGKLYRLSGDPLRASLVGRVPGQQGVQLLAVAGRTLVAASNAGALVRVDAGHAERGTYLSDIRDARTVATWGMVSWRATVPAGGGVEVSTRSGNTATPDDAWSAWSAPYASSEGSAVTSPAARYLQWRVVLTGKGDSPVVTSLQVAYLQRNQRPVVSGLVVHPPGVVFQKPFSTGETEIAGYQADVLERQLANQGQPAPSTGAPSLGRRTYQRGLQTLVWKGDDPNGDDLTFSVAYRREGDTTWRTLVAGLTDPIYVWDTTAVPSGSYVIRIAATDAEAQPAATALTGELESAVIDVDNEPPVLTAGAVRRDGDRLIVTVNVRDGQSAVGGIEYALDGRTWLAAWADDGLLDGRHETTTLRLPADRAGQAVVVRATDALQNTGTVTVRLP
ncbi:MAG: hypothetical protein AB7U83_02435 [Vicinamibacterales bacterium]